MADYKAPMHKHKVGYDCEFVKKPQDAFQTECPICLHTLRDPYQASCCGTCYCSACYGRLQAGNKPCPNCNNPAFPVFEDKSKRHTLIKLQVYCTHKDRGCKWTGELGDLERHLNQDPKKGAEKNGCDFVRVCCVHCNDQFERRSLDKHPFDNCPKRRIQCTNESKGCNWQGELGELDGHLLTKCSANLVACPNKCGERVHHLDLDSHKEGSCSMAIVDCDFKSVGCRVQLPRKDMCRHLNENSHNHVMLLMEKSRKLEAENATKTAEIEALRNQQQGLAAENAAKVVEIENLKADVERGKRESSTEVQQLRRDLGYQLSGKWLFILSFVAVGIMALLIGNSGTQLAATRIEFQIQIADLQNETGHKIADLQKASGELQQEIVDLKTESEGSIAILQNKLTTTRNELLIQIADLQNETSHKITDLQKASGENITDLQKELTLSNGTLQQQIVDLQTKSENNMTDLQNKLATARKQHNETEQILFGVVQNMTLLMKLNLPYIAQGFTLHEFTLTGFSKWQAEGDSGDWYSEPLYSHPGGYKFQPRISTNGWSSARGVYMTVWFYLLKGVHDNNLKWPMIDTAHVQLLNQLGDHGHLEKTSTYSWSKGDSYVYGGWIHKFIKLSELGLNADKNTQYLKNDRLKFRVYFKARPQP